MVHDPTAMIRVVARLLACGLPFFCGATEARAQGGGIVWVTSRIWYEAPGEISTLCSISGQWMGPWDFEGVINPDLRVPGAEEADARDWAEIAHAILLPPPVDQDPPSYSRRVLFLCRRSDLSEHSHLFPKSAGDIPAQSFIWDRTEPEELMIENVGTFMGGARDPFCGGHTHTKAGNVLVVGGADEKAQQAYIEAQLLQGVVDPEFLAHGHSSAALFINDPVDPYWVTDLPPMAFARWYPTAIRIGDGSIVVAGHAHEPDETASQYRERVDVIDGSNDISWRTYTDPQPDPDETKAYLLNEVGPINPNGDSCDSTDVHDFGIYPRLSLLTDGNLMSTDASPRVLHLDVCSDPPNPDRIETMTSSQNPHREANIVRFVDLRGSSPAEFFYSIGGAEPPPSGGGSKWVGSHQVLRMDVDEQVPGASTWTVVQGAQLREGRFYGNSVILLDGSILAVGGGGEDNGVEWYAMRPERYRPPGVFETADSGWTYMAVQAHERTYHSVALLLPNGDVVSAGGQGQSGWKTAPNRPSGPVPPWYSVELYRPPYMCSTARPVIHVPPETMVIGGNSLELSVTLQSTSSEGETRVAILAPGSVTHHMDSSQAYIILDMTVLSLNPVPTQPSTIQVTPPLNRNVTPEGWYLLTVVNAAGLPSAARWIKLVQSP